MAATKVTTESPYTLEEHGLEDLGKVRWNLSSTELIELAIRNGEAILSVNGQLVVETGEHTGRSAKDKFLVSEAEVADQLWWGEVNQAISLEHFDKLHAEIVENYRGRDAYVLDAAGGADPEYRLPIRVVTEQAWHSLFARTLFLRLPREEATNQVPEFTILHAPSVFADPDVHGTRSGAFIILNLKKNMALIGGTSYAGEIKKTVFTVLNYLLPLRGVLPMHCSANLGDDGDVALYFGLSGTGKTTLSSVADRFLIGDDEHGWGDTGIFNFEGGCYAKMIRLSPEDEPIIWAATQRFGTVLENVILDPQTRAPDFDDDRLTENTRGAYPIEFVRNSVADGMGGHPEHVFFLTADAFGVMPPISRLTPEQAMYYFLSGYTSKLAGTEKGLGDEPEATFSACFGAPFLPLPPGVYAELLGENVAKHDTTVWLVNTGWTGGPHGTGERIKLPFTRAMVRAALKGQLSDVPTRKDPFFGLSVPERCPNVPDEVLDPKRTWADPGAYDEQARMLAGRFRDNFAAYGSSVSDDIVTAGPAG